MTFRLRGDPRHPVPDDVEEVASQVLDALFEVHTELGAGLLESVVAAALVRALGDKELRVEREVPILATFRGEPLGVAFRADLIVEGCVLVELKVVAALTEAHEAQVLTYLRLSGLPVAFLANFHERHLRAGIRRYVHPRVMARPDGPP